MNEDRGELMKSQEKLRKLQIENEELQRSLFQVNEKLVDSEKLKGHFISNITNEIINPFTSIMALSRNIGQLKAGEIDKAHRMAGLIYDEAFHLDFQLKNIFAAALIEAGTEGVKLTQVNISELIDRVLIYFQSQWSKKSIQIVVNQSNLNTNEESIVFVSDWEKLDLILKNLVSNSIKFSPENSVIELNVFLDKGKLTIQVSDQGKGLSEADMRVIFDRFKQLDEKINSVNTGHGLGLSVVQAYTDMLQGGVHISTKSKSGILVEITLPEMQQTNGWDDFDNFLLDSDTIF